jgi:hypothetical protein
MTKIELVFGDVVQIDPATPDCFFGGCFMLVTDPKPWGAMGFIALPRERGESPGAAYFRATWEQMAFVGHAAWEPAK